LHDTLDEQVFSLQPAGFVDYVCKLSKSLYGLKQAPWTWFHWFTEVARSLGFQPTRSDVSLFTLRHRTEMAFLLLYIDDIILTASSDALLHGIVARLGASLAIKDLGPVHYFLSVQVTQSPAGFFLS
jgi:hypothetical protein